MKKIKSQSRRLVLTVLAFLIVMLSFTPLMKRASAADDFDALRTKWGQKLTGGSYSSTDSDIFYYLVSLAGSITNKNRTGLLDTLDRSSSRTYLWSNLNRPTSNPAYSNDIYTVYSRLKTMALALKSPGSSLYMNPTLKTEIISAMDWMYDHRYNENETEYAGTNWWEWEIGAPLFLLDTIVLMYNDLSADQVTKYLRAIDKFCPNPTMKSDGQWVETGANRVDKSLIVTLRGILGKNSNKMMQGRDALSLVLAYVTKGDGFYKDGSFIQHDNVPSTGSYGYVLLDHLTDLLYLTNGSSWEVQDPNVANIQNWVLQSFEPLIYKGAMMDSVRGRSISREDLRDYKIGRELSIIILRLAQISKTDQALELRKMVKAWILSENRYENYYWGLTINGMLLVKSVLNNASIVPKADLLRNVQYPSMDRVVHLRPNFAFGISMYSNRTTNYELMNNENLKGWYTNEGMTYLYNNDLSQYSDQYWPTVNAYRLPGVTTDGAPRKDGFESSKSFVGGVSLDRLYGTAGMDLGPDNSTLEGKKSWFMFDDEIVALGAGITSRDSRKVETIVENRKLNAAGSNKLTVNNTAKSSTLGWSETMSGVEWAHLQGSVANSDIGYYFPDKSNIDGLREQRTGSWNQINQAGSTTQIKKSYLSLAINHGMKPVDASYSYVVLPNRTAAQTSAYSANPDIQILSNTKMVQAVKEQKLGIIQANFWSAGSVEYIIARNPAAVVAQQTGNQLSIAISDPTQMNPNVVVEIGKVAAAVISKDPSVTILQSAPTTVISVNTSGSMGATHSVKLTLNTSVPTTYPTTVELAPIADSFVRNGTYATTNYGSSNILPIANGSTDYARQAFLKFDISSIIGKIESANLIVYGATTDSKGNDSSIAAYSVLDNNWIENKVNWNNKPQINALLQEVRFEGNHQWRNFNVTSFVKTQSESNNKNFSFALVQTGKALFAEIFSRENAINKPKLQILYFKETTSGSGTTGGTAGGTTGSTTGSSGATTGGNSGTASVRTISAFADSFVRDGMYATSNYGLEKTLGAKTSAQKDDNQKSIIKFDLSSWDTSIANAKLRIYTNYIEGNNALIEVFVSPESGWQENKVTWNTFPTRLDSPIRTVNLKASGAYIDLDVTAFIRSQQEEGIKIVSFTVENATKDVSVLFDSRESSHPPQLVIQ
ncbi:hypothetical protein Back11_31760 [Paenibacillus baekrokdamisoli]|uniref:Uncharacterized protein n=1 Tax=Paenibacillus baekrokdamisoli TaxID=1712516 RepID=A0A3G9J7Q2_9BACL|nr:polysaccharide lyase family 8 super-sandwich domain-containing protein [Paenibacillus baekrokdamisoli]MBB3071659.1 hypothetical protein [Paenibacillus baekrokdamisoli]BBH21831.1 hypothetical protein Back11_31760 [Paenibacillus baekrokdamisoli]